MQSRTCITFFSSLLAVTVAPVQAQDPLASWNDVASKEAIISFVEKVVEPNSSHFIPQTERIATFDNDGTLWSEQPLYFQLAFAIDRVRALAPQHPEWKEKQPFKAVLEGNIETALAGGEHTALELIMATHSGITTEEFAETVRKWIETARHPKTGKLYTEMVYQPMLEVLDYLRANGFKTYIVSGGGIEFMRVFAEDVYGIPPEQVIGSSVKTKFEIQNGTPVIVRLPELNFLDDKGEKPVAINQHIGRRPVASFGNSDGDLQMLQWSDAGETLGLQVYIHHTDDMREWAYDRESSIGRLNKGLDEAEAKNWIVVDMKNDWAIIYPFEKK
jgi:phosphoglycolate phosphatase-like HAD superfamily hydrolase